MYLPISSAQPFKVAVQLLLIQAAAKATSVICTHPVALMASSQDSVGATYGAHLPPQVGPESLGMGPGRHIPGMGSHAFFLRLHANSV